MAAMTMLAASLGYPSSAATPPSFARSLAVVRHPTGKAPTDTALWIQMRNVNLHIDDTHVMRVGELHGQVIPVQPGVIPLLDDVNSFRIRVTDATVALGGDDLAALLNDRVFAYKGSPIRNVKARVGGGVVVISGIMHKGVDLPFEMTSTLSLDPDGRIRSHPQHMKILGVNGTLLLHALGLHLDKVLDLRGSHGASVSGDDLLLDPIQMIPPPAIEGRLASVRVEGDLVTQSFQRTADDTVFGTAVRVDSSARNFVYFRGGSLRFGKLTMTDTDLLINDADPRDPFDLYMAKYNTQLVAGTTRTLPDFGLRVTMPDYSKVVGGATVATR